MKSGQVWIQSLLLRKTYGDKLDSQAVQFVWMLEQTLHGEVQLTQILSIGTSPAIQLATQSFPSKFRVVHEVQLDVSPSQVKQSPVQASAIPEILAYPLGVCV